MRKTLKILSSLMAILFILTTFSVSLSAYAVEDDTVGNYNFTIVDNPYEDIKWDNGKLHAFKSSTHAHTVLSDGDIELNDTIWYHYMTGYEVLALTDHGTVNGVEIKVNGNVTGITGANGRNSNWTDAQSRCALYGYQTFVHGGVDDITETDYINIINGENVGNRPANLVAEKRGMFNMPLGNEANALTTNKCHVNTYGVSFGHGANRSASWPADTVKESYEVGAFSRINHVGEWTDGNSDPSVYTSSWVKDYVSIFENYCPNRNYTPAEADKWENADPLTGEKFVKGVIGMELVNTGDSRTRNDRRYVYDESLKLLAPQGINMWGFCEDDSHEESDIDRNAQFFLVNDGTASSVYDDAYYQSQYGSGASLGYTGDIRYSMTNGEFYASSKTSKNAYELGDGFNPVGDYPSMNNFKIDESKNQIIMSVNNASKVRIVADGNILDTLIINETSDFATVAFDLNKYEDQINSYVRIYMTGNGGITYLQPILLSKSYSPISTVTFNTPSYDTTIKVYNAQGALVQPINSENVYTLDEGNYTYIASRPGYITTEPIAFTVTKTDIDNAVQKVIDVTLEVDEDIIFTYFYVPETIYVNTGDTSLFQYYVDRQNAVGGALKSDISTTGNIYFNREGASNISISCKVIDGPALSGVTLSKTTSASNELSATITQGKLSSALASNSSALLEWTATYTINNEEFSVISYSYIYAPLTGYGSVAAAGGYAETSKNVFGWAHSTMSVTGTVWLAGAHSVTGGSAAYKFAPYGGDAFVNASGVGSITTTGSGMSTASDDSSGGSVNLAPSGSSATLTIDVSRYNNFNQIPNLAVGLDLNDASSCDEGDADQYLNFGNTQLYYLTGVAANSMSGQRLYSSDNTDPSRDLDIAINQSANAINIVGQVQGHKSSRSDTVTGTVTLNLSYVNKSALRQQYESAIKPGYQKGWFASEYDYTYYMQALKQAAIALGNPAATATDITNATKAVADVVANATFKNGTANINFLDTKGNFISSTTLDYVLGDTILISAEEFDGYTYADRWEYVVDGEVVNSGTTTYCSAIATQVAPKWNFYFEANDYNVSYTTPGLDNYVPDNGNITSVEYNSIFRLPTNIPEKEGYTFDGWYLEANNTLYPAGGTVKWNVLSDGEFIAMYTGKKYTATYDMDGGLGLISTSEQITFGDYFNISTIIPKKEGYTFAGWDLVDANGNVIDNHAAGGRFTWDVASNLTLKAVWTIITFKVTLDPMGGEIGTEYVDIAYGGKYGTLPAPTLEGYEFSGWYLDKDYTQAVTESTLMTLTEDHTLYAKWTLGEYSVTYLVDGEVYTTDYYHFGDTIDVVDEPEKEGHTFSGWSSIPATMPGENITVTGSFTANSYTITFILDGEEFHKETLQYGAKITAPTVPTITGSTFSGWIDLPKTMPAQNITINGNYTANVYKVSYYLNGELFDVQEYHYGDTVTAIDAPTKIGYTFSGWSNVPATMPDQDIRVTGTLTISKHTLTYYVDGAEYFSQSLTYGTAITPLAAPTKKGYTFSGWSSIPATMPDSDVSIYGTFESEKYTISYYVDGVLYDTQKLGYGETIVLIDYPVKEGHTFSGWTTTPATMPTRNLTVNGIFTANTYTYKFVLDGVEQTAWTITAKYGTAIKAPVPEVSDGYTFSGWSPAVPQTMGAGDTTFYGSISKAYAVYSFDINGATGTAPENQTYEIGSTVDLPSNDSFSKTGYTFNGWSKDKNADAGVTSVTVGADDTTMYAVWSMITLYIESADDSSTVIDAINGLIYGVKENLTEDEFESQYIEIVGENGAIDYEKGLDLGTGTVIKLRDTATDSVVATYTLVVYGDVDGDGVADGQDVVLTTMLANGYLTSSDVSHAVFEAADTDHDGEITANDVAEITNSGLMTFDIIQTK